MTVSMELTVENVRETTLSCLWGETDRPIADIDDAPDGAVVVQGIVRSYVFRRDRIEEQDGRIGAMLAQLPDSFMETKGGGWSFLNACIRQDNQQWADLHTDMEALFALGIAANKARWCFPREMWSALYGGMPYVIVLDGNEPPP